MEFSTSPLFISPPCAHPKIIIHFREEMLVQKLKRKQKYWSPTANSIFLLFPQD